MRRGAARGFALTGRIGSGAAIVATMAGLVACPAAAGPNAGARIALHLMAPTAKSACERADLPQACRGIVTTGGLYPRKYFVYLLVTGADSAAGVAGVQCGVDYLEKPQTGFDVFEWRNCATLEFPSDDWPAPGGGNLITWDRTTRCQRPSRSGPGVAAVAGYFYGAAYTPDTFYLIPRPVDGCAKVAACSTVEDTLQSPTLFRRIEPLGFAVFSAAPGAAAEGGYNPCGAMESQEKDPRFGWMARKQWQERRDRLAVKVELPHTFRLGPGKALLVGGLLYEAGERVRLEFDPEHLVLRANGAPVDHWAKSRLRFGDPLIARPIWITAAQAAEEAAGQFLQRYDATDSQPLTSIIELDGYRGYRGPDAPRAVLLIRAVLAGEQAKPEIVRLADSLHFGIDDIRRLARAGRDSTHR